MVHRVILACEMIEDEVRLALEALPPESRPPIVWVESGLHDRPERLNAALQDLVDRLDEGSLREQRSTCLRSRPAQARRAERRVTVSVGPVSEVLLALGFCGKGLQGLGSQELDLVFPRVDDCISMFLNDGCVREQIPRDTRSYYRHSGMVPSQQLSDQAFEEWDGALRRERAATLRQAMFAGYERVTLIDTKAYEVADCIEQSEAYAEELDLEHRVVSGSVQLLERLFKGERDSEIVVVPAGEEIGFTHLFAAAEAEG